MEKRARERCKREKRAAEPSLPSPEPPGGLRRGCSSVRRRVTALISDLRTFHNRLGTLGAPGSGCATVGGDKHVLAGLSPPLAQQHGGQGVWAPLERGWDLAVGTGTAKGLSSTFTWPHSEMGTQQNQLWARTSRSFPCTSQPLP